MGERGGGARGVWTASRGTQIKARERYPRPAPSDMPSDSRIVKYSASCCCEGVVAGGCCGERGGGAGGGEGGRGKVSGCVGGVRVWAASGPAGGEGGRITKDHRARLGGSEFLLVLQILLYLRFCSSRIGFRFFR